MGKPYAGTVTDIKQSVIKKTVSVKFVTECRLPQGNTIPINNMRFVIGPITRKVGDRLYTKHSYFKVV